MLREALVAALLLGVSVPAAAQVSVRGAVTESAGPGSPQPVPGAHVLATAGSPGRIAAEAETDSKGRYLLEGLPAGRVTLSVQAQGYYTLRAGGLESDSIARSCPEQGDCGETDFEIARAAVVEGWLTDSYGDPRQDILLELVADASAQIADPAQRMRGIGRAFSDDRGYFRIWDVKPGRYELTLRQMGFGSRGGPPVELHKQTLEITPGQLLQEARIALRTDANVFSLSGEILGAGEEGLERTGVAIQQVGGDERTNWTTYESIREGKFTFTGVRKGDYVLRLVKFSQNTGKWRYLDTITLDRDLKDLQLTVKPPTGVRGRVEFVDAPAAPVYLGIREPGSQGFPRENIEAVAPDYAFENEGLPPGEYELTLRNEDYYLVEPVRITVTVGRMQELELRVANQRATVRGSARLAGPDAPQAAAHFTVAMRGERGRHKIQADDAGGFVFEKVIPGEYEIAAWDSPDVDITDDAVWRTAGENRKRLTLEPGFETEIDLTVTR